MQEPIKENSCLGFNKIDIDINAYLTLIWVLYMSFAYHRFLHFKLTFFSFYCQVLSQTTEVKQV